jgi:hypothetical protein
MPQNEKPPTFVSGEASRQQGGEVSAKPASGYARSVCNVNARRDGGIFQKKRGVFPVCYAHALPQCWFG